MSAPPGCPMARRAKGAPLTPAAIVAIAALVAATSATCATVEQPRAFGYVIGDVVMQRVLLQEGEPIALPAADRIGLWLERRTPRIGADRQGRRWLEVEYQIINAPRALTVVALPPLRIATRSGATLAVPEWRLSVGPLTPALAAGDPQELRPDRAVAALPTASIERQLTGSIVALALVLCSWLGWWLWRNRREAQRLPFARARSELRRIDPGSAEGWLVLHRALNATAGRVVHGTTLPRLLADAPHLLPLQGRLEGFYRQSSQRFFADAPGSAPYPLLDLCCALRDAEKRQLR